MKLALFACVVAACAAPAAGTSSLVATVPASMTACPNGGIEVDTGLDTNGDGVLEPAEVTSRSNVCAGQNGTNGTNGTNGADGSNGTNGTNGSNATNLLVRVDSEPPGPNCAAGGEAIRVGADTNGDGVLEDTEVQDTAYLCGALPAPTVIDGDYAIANDLDVAALANVTEVTGQVTVTSSTITSLSLPNLTHVGSLNTRNTYSLTSLSLPALVTAGGTNAGGGIYIGDVTIGVYVSTVDLSSLTSANVTSWSIQPSALSLPALQTGSVSLIDGWTTSLTTSLVHGLVYVYDEPKLTSITLDGLVDGSVFINSVPLLPSLALPAMTTEAGGGRALDVSQAAQLVSIAAPRLATGDVLVAWTPALTTLDLSALQQGVVGIGPTALTTLSLPALVSAPQLGVSGSPSLTTISAPNLGPGTTSFNATNDPLLPTCMATALAAQCGATDVVISGTDDAATCP